MGDTFKLIIGVVERFTVSLVEYLKISIVLNKCQFIPAPNSNASYAALDAPPPLPPISKGTFAAINSVRSCVYGIPS